MSDFINSFAILIRKEIEKNEWKAKIVEPLLKWLFIGMLPYVIGLLFLNFFMTIGAVSLVIYLYK